MTKTILILAANPIGEEALSVGSEMKALRKLLQPNFKVELSLETSWDDFNEELLRCNPDVVHFVGHGESKNGLVLEDGDGNGAGVTGDRLAALFKLFPQVECVVMNACQTEKVAAAIHPYVPCVIGMSQSIADEAAREFSLAFYQAVLQEKGYVWAFEFGKVRIASGFDRLHPTLLMREKPIVENLEAPGGRMSVESRLYVDRPMAEEDASREVLRSGALIRIKGPVEFGKSSLMARVVMKAEEQGAKTVSINFREIVPESLVSLKVFLRFFCTIVSRKLKFENQVQNYFDSGLGEMMECAEYFEDYLLPQISSSLVLELDEVDVLLHEHLEKGWVVDFFSMLRAWYDSKMNAHSQWKKLRIVLVHSREVNHETLNQNKSPFNVGKEVPLREFNVEQGVNLAQLHGVELSVTHELMNLVGGHPQLLRQGLYSIARREVSWTELQETGATEAGLYGQHLEDMRGRIESDEGLKRALREVLAMGEAGKTIDLKYKAKLRSFGLVVYQGNGVRIACELYRQYFSELWK